MAKVNISITKEGEDILVRNTEGREIKILNDIKELKATDVISFLNYSNENEYELLEIDEYLKDDKNVFCVYTIFEEIIGQINIK